MLISGICTGAGAASAATVTPATVTPADTAASATALNLSAPSVDYGDEQTEVFTVTVTGAGATPTGTATVTAGATTVCTIELVDGAGTCALTADEIAVGTVELAAAYSGDASYDPSTAPTADFQVTSPSPPPPAATVTSLGLSKAGVFYGAEQAEQISVKVAAPDDGGAVPAGRVIVGYGTAKLCTVSLSSAGAAVCGLKATALPPAKVKLTASYSGAAAFSASAAAATLTVAKEPTILAAALSTSKISYGAEQRERITVAVKPAYGGAATGHVAVKAGSTTIRVITLAAGKGGYTLGPTSLAGGSPRLTLSYSGDGHYAGSASTAKLSVAKAPSKTALGVSATKIAYGAEQRERITVAVKLAYAGTATGHVTVSAGSRVICAVPLKAARAACVLAAARLPTGHQQLSAVYSGSGDADASAAATRVLSIIKASSATALSLSAAQVEYGSEGAAKISVRVAPQYVGTPAGTVTVRANGAVLAVIRLKSGVGGFALSAKRFAAGTYRLAASYGGNADFTGSTSAKQTLTVTSPPPPPPPPPACYPLSSRGTCYEPGEFCPAADHGETGIAGDGEQIVCEDNNGWRWEPLG